MEPILRVKVENFFKSENLKKCHHLLLVYDASKLSTVYVVKLLVLGLLWAPENSEFAPSF